MKTGKKKVVVKRAASKRAVRKAAPAVQAEPKVDVYAEACKAGSPKVALVKRAGDSHPVQIKDEAHLQKLREAHGADGVEVQQ